MTKITINPIIAKKLTKDINEFIDNHEFFEKTTIPQLTYITATSLALVLAKQMKDKSQNDQFEILNLFKQTFSEQYYRLLKEFRNRGHIVLK